MTVVENLFEVGGAERAGKVESLGERAIEHAQGPQLLGGQRPDFDTIDVQEAIQDEAAIRDASMRGKDRLELGTNVNRRGDRLQAERTSRWSGDRWGARPLFLAR